jgi:hypothetical protein
MNGLLQLGNNALLRPGEQTPTDYSAVLSTAGLIGYWPLTVDTLAPATVVADKTGRRQGLTLTGSPLMADVGTTRSLKFNGSTQYAARTYDFGFNGRYSLSFSLWFYATSLAANMAVFQKHIEKPSDQTYSTWEAYVLTDGSVITGLGHAGLDQYPRVQSAPGLIVPNRWYHLAYSWRNDGSGSWDHQQWLNGAYITQSGTFFANGYSEAFFVEETNSPVTIGARFTSTTNLFFNGLIRDVRLYNRKLFRSEPQEIYKAGLAGSRTKPFGPSQFDAPMLPPTITAYLRPDADDSISDWKNEADGTTNLYASIDESVAGDADYIKSPVPPNGSVARFRLSNPAAGKVLATPVVVSYRFKKTTSTDQKLTASLKQDTTLIKSWTHTGAGLTTAFQTVNQTLSGGEIAAITNFNNLFVEFKAEGTAPNFWDATNKGADISVSSDGSVASQSGGAANNGSNIRSIVGKPTGGVYQFSVTVAGGTFAGEGMAIGFGNEYFTNGIVAPGRWPGGGNQSQNYASIAIWNDGVIYLNANVMATYFTFVSGDKITCWVDYTTAGGAKVSFKRNNDNWNNNAANDPTVGYITWPGNGTLAYALIAVDTSCSTAAVSPGWV